MSESDTVSINKFIDYIESIFPEDTASVDSLVDVFAPKKILEDVDGDAAMKALRLLTFLYAMRFAAPVAVEMGGNDLLTSLWQSIGKHFSVNWMELEKPGKKLLESMEQFNDPEGFGQTVGATMLIDLYWDCYDLITDNVTVWDKKAYPKPGGWVWRSKVNDDAVYCMTAPAGIMLWFDRVKQDKIDSFFRYKEYKRYVLYDLPPEVVADCKDEELQQHELACWTTGTEDIDNWIRAINKVGITHQYNTKKDEERKIYCAKASVFWGIFRCAAWNVAAYRGGDWSDYVDMYELDKDPDDFHSLLHSEVPGLEGESICAMVEDNFILGGACYHLDLKRLKDLPGEQIITLVDLGLDDDLPERDAVDLFTGKTGGWGESRHES